jgi:hypothetical protein
MSMQIFIDGEDVSQPTFGWLDEAALIKEDSNENQTDQG